MNSNKRRGREKFPFCIGQDLIRWRITVSSFQHLECLGKKIPEIAWFIKYADISKELFDVAAQHPGLVLHFGINFVKYCDVIRKNAAEQNIDIGGHPLVVHAYPIETKLDKDDFKIANENDIKSKEDYLDIIQSEDDKYGEDKQY